MSTSETTPTTKQSATATNKKTVVPPTAKKTPDWIGCKQGGGFRAKGTVIAMSSITVDTPYHVRLDMKNTNVKTYYYQVKIHSLEGFLSVGVVNDAKGEFQPGWDIKGMFFNGNLINGKETVKVGWGPGFTVGDTLGVRYTKATLNSSSGSGGEEENNTSNNNTGTSASVIEVSYFKNGEALGVGFRLKVQETDATNNPIFYQPCISIRGKTQLVLEVPQKLPSSHIDRSIPKNFFGDWKLLEAYRGTADDFQLRIPSDKDYIMKLYVHTDTSISLTFRISNSIMGKAQIIEQNDTQMTIECGELLNTMMSCPSELKPIETLLEKEEKTTIELLQDEKQLILSGPEMKTIWQYIPKNPEPLTEY